MQKSVYSAPKWQASELHRNIYLLKLGILLFECTHLLCIWIFWAMD